MNMVLVIGCGDRRVQDEVTRQCRRFDLGEGTYRRTPLGAARTLVDPFTQAAVLYELEPLLKDVDLIVIIEHDGGRVRPDGTKADLGCAEYNYRLGGSSGELDPREEYHAHRATLVGAVEVLRGFIRGLYVVGIRKKDPGAVRFVTLIDHHGGDVEEVDVVALASQLGMTERCD